MLVISTTSTFFKMVYKSQKNVSNLLALAQKVSLIKCVDAKWSYTKGKAKVYAWNKNSESILISLFKSFNINIKQYQSSINQSSYNNIDRNIRDNSDIPDEDYLIDIDKRRQEALQKLIDEQVISRRDASWLYLKLYDEEHTFKESRSGWCIEDRLKAKPARTYIMNTLVNRYPTKFTRKDVMNFIGG